MKGIKLGSHFFLVFFMTLSGCKGFNNPVINEVIQLGSNREIFVDHYLIDELKGTNIVMHHPHDEGIVMYFDKPWEGISCSCCTIIKEEDVYRLYYRASGNASNSTSTCYAESKDGINWVKPVLGLFEVNGSINNNVILDTVATGNFSPFLDTNPNAKPNQKYKALGGGGESGLIPYVSSDGIHWNQLQDEGVIKKGNFDSQNVVFWSESERLYVCYFRISYLKVRSVSRTTSSDFINWSEPVRMTFGDTPNEHIYIQQTSPYFRAPHIYIAIGARFMPNRQALTVEQALKLKVNPDNIKDVSDAIIMTTRGGNVYDRLFMESFIRPGIGLNNWVTRTNYPALNVVQTGPEEMSVYLNQDYVQPTAHLHRYSLRLDGFTSISAPYTGGEVITKPFIFSGKELEINYSTSAAGEIRIEIQDENGKPIPGYTMEESQTIFGNEIARVVSWNGNENVKELASKPVRLRIYMKDADLYSLRFKEKHSFN